MAFGFPAYAIGSQNLNADADILRNSVCNALSALGWGFSVVDANTIIANIPISLFSWGEKLTISFTGDGRLNAKSEGVLPTQFVDWGKNKKNIKLFFSQLHQTNPALISLNLNKTPAMFDKSGMTPVERVFSEGEK